MSPLKPYRIPERIYFNNGELRVEGEMVMYLASEVEALLKTLEMTTQEATR